MKTKLLLAAALVGTCTVHAQVVYQFSADEGAPTAQGFTESSSDTLPPMAITHRNEAAWLIEDANITDAGYHYSHTINTSDVSTLQTRGYRVSARVAFFDTDYNGQPSCHFLFTDGSRTFLVWLDETSSNELQLLLETDDVPVPINLGSENVHDYYNIDIDVAPGGTTADLLVNGEVMYTGWTGQLTPTLAGNYLLQFGNISVEGQGAAAWNRVQIASRVPESDMTFFYSNNSDSYGLSTVADVAGHLHIPDTFNDGTHGGKPVTTISQFACAPNSVGHTNLVSLRLPTSLTYIDIHAFTGCTGLTGSLTLPEGLTSMGTGVFFRCIGFTGPLTIPSSLTSIAVDTFNQCRGFTRLTLPATLTSIQNHAFFGCSGLTGTLTIPAGVTFIDSLALADCSALEEVCWLGAPPTSYGITSFPGNPDGDEPFQNTPATHYVPEAYLTAYQALPGLSGALAKTQENAIILTITRDGNQFTITYLTHTGYLHQPEVSSDLETWSNYGASVTGDDQTHHFMINPADASRRYFRVLSHSQE